MAFTNIDDTKPTGSEKVSTADDYIRGLKTDMETNLAEISGYPNTPTIRELTWTTAGRPTTLVDGMTGYNSTLSSEEHYDLGTTTWIQHGTATATIQTLVDAVVPVGSILMWSGAVATIPTKWHLADGTSGTIDLTNRFVVCAGADGGTYVPGDDGVGTGDYAPGATGGEDKHILATTQMPSHSHTGGYLMTSYATNITTGGGGQAGRDQSSIGSTGGGLSHENRPPYYALAFIQRIS